MSSYINNQTLSLLILKEGFYYLLLNKKKIIKYNFIKLTAKNKSDFFETFKQLFEKEFSKYTLDFIDVSFLNKKFAIVPSEYFDIKNSYNQFKIGGPLNKSESLRYNILYTKNKATLLYNYDENIEYYLTKKYKNIRFIHSGTRIITKSISKNEEYIQIILYKSEFEIKVYKNNIFQLYTMENFTTSHEIIYHLLNISEQLQLSKYCKVIVLGDSPIISQLLKELEKNKISAKLAFEEKSTNYFYALLN